jgi:RNA polymerase sigma-70 factor (ECF subfamily)
MRMNATRPEDTDQLLRRAAAGDADARSQLLARHRQRLLRMIEVRLDRRLRPRIDPSDVVQDALAEAAQKLSDFARRRPLPFYPWLRRLAWERLVQLLRCHLRAQRRSVRREEPGGLPLPDESAGHLAERLAARGSSPSQRLRHAEQRRRVQQTLTRLGGADREVLVLRYLEDLSTAEIASVLELTESAVKMRQLRALQRLRDLLSDEELPEEP